MKKRHIWTFFCFYYASRSSAHRAASVRNLYTKMYKKIRNFFFHWSRGVALCDRVGGFSGIHIRNSEVMKFSLRLALIEIGSSVKLRNHVLGGRRIPGRYFPQHLQCQHSILRCRGDDRDTCGSAGTTGQRVGVLGVNVPFEQR